MTLRPRRPRRRNEAGAVALLTAACLTALLVAAAMVLDFGLARIVDGLIAHLPDGS